MTITRFIVRGHSMRPAFRQGDVLALAPAPLESIRRGQVIVFRAPDRDPGDWVVHRHRRADHCGRSAPGVDSTPIPHPAPSPEDQAGAVDDLPSTQLLTDTLPAAARHALAALLPVPLVGSGAGRGTGGMALGVAAPAVVSSRA
jgi:hypothetical protein